MLRVTSLIGILCASLPLAAWGAPSPPSPLDAELTKITSLLTGRYAGSMADPLDPTGGKTIRLHHKIVSIEAPQFGQRVFYHQISRDAVDSLQPTQQKIYVFDLDPARKQNRMRSFVFYPKSGYANLERDPAALRQLQPQQLMSFPAGCEINWSEEAGEVFFARVRLGDCRYESAAFKQTILPLLTYRVSRDAFAIEDVLHDANRKPLYPSMGLASAARLPATLAAVLAASAPAEWREPDPARTLYMDLDIGRVIFELSATFAPAHLANIRTLVKAGWFDGLSINRVQDNFVTQWGDATSSRKLNGAAERVAPEFEREWTADLPYTALPDGDVYAPQVGFSDGFPVAGDRAQGRIWLAHCYGALGVGRDNGADSGNGSELYVVIGHAPRQLDRNITVAGRALQGMELLAALPRGGEAMGFYGDAAQRVPIRRMRFAEDVPLTERVPLEVLRTNTASFIEAVESRRNRRDEWYLRPAGRIDLCSVPIPVRRKVSP